MHDERSQTATNAGPMGEPADSDEPTGPAQGDATTGRAGEYDDDGALAQQTPGLDPEPIREEAGPDWPAGTTGDLEADTAPGGGSGAQPSSDSNVGG